MAMSRMLVIDDDRELCELLSDYLKPEGFDLEAVFDAEQGILRALSGDHILVVLDVMLPGISGFEALRRIREQSRIPVIMLTARGDDVDRIVGLEMGADDYLPKPFNPRELVARVRAIQRRAGPASGDERGGAPGRLAVGDVVLDAMTRTVTRAGTKIELTAIEFGLLEELLRGAGRVVTRGELSKKVLGRGLSPYDRSIDVHVSSLRKKLGHEVEGAERIRTVRGVGYLYTSPEKPGESEKR
jgi:DNA-binding response OmpR family regulator